MDVTPRGSGWMAACSECRQSQAVGEQGDGWQWLLMHDCAGLDPASADSDPDVT